MPFSAIWRDLGTITVNEVSQREKDKYYIISLTCGILKDKTNKQNKTNTQIWRTD